MLIGLFTGDVNLHYLDKVAFRKFFHYQGFLGFFFFAL